MSTWTEVKAVLSAAPLDWSIWDAAFERHGVNGTVQTDEPPTIAGFVAPETDHADLESELRAMGAKVGVREVKEVDWAEAWKQFFVPRRVGERFMVVPSWSDFQPEPDDLVITLDPGQAFGTGDHPTTRGCLVLLEREGAAGKDVGDIGCGSGILSVGAGLLGARSIVAVDIEPVSVNSARENLARNGVSGEVLVGTGFDPVPEDRQFDLVLSNIISAALISLAHIASGRIRFGGAWIVSGIIQANWPDVRARAEQCGFTLVDELMEGDWVAARFRRA